MITLQIPELKVQTLYEACLLTNGLDIADRDWDMGIYFECGKTWNDAVDWYEKLMMIFGINIRVERMDTVGYTTCMIADFLWENRDVFDVFFNEHNRHGYRPKDYNNLDPELDTGFFEAYMQPFESLLAGNYTDDDYKELYQMLSDKAAKNKSEKSQNN